LRKRVEEEEIMSGTPFLYFCTEWIWVGRGSLEQAVPEAKKLGAQKALIITDPGVHQAGVSARVRGILEKAGVQSEIFSSIKPEPPLELVDQCAEIARKGKMDLIVGVGGGSSMDTAKGASVVVTNGGSVSKYFGIDQVPKPGVPTFLIPTTAGTGAEATRNAIFKDLKAKAKKAIVSRHILPRVAIVDAELMRTTPPGVTAHTGIDALGHALESFMSKNASPLSEMYSLQTIKLVAENLQRAVENGNDMDARENMALAALCGGVSLMAGAGAIAATSYPVEGHFDVPHGLGNALMMPVVMRYNTPANIPRAKKICEQMGVDIRGLSDQEIADRLVEKISDLFGKIGIPLGLGKRGVKEKDLPMLAAEAFQNKRLVDLNPRELTVESIMEIYRQAL
jgi:alcohol dehydrogenase class IV